MSERELLIASRDPWEPTRNFLAALSEWEYPRPDVRGGCMRCRVTPQDVDAGRVIVSPTGLAHFGQDGGDTACGINATGNKWWWPL
jgi:hypothetical protein